MTMLRQLGLRALVVPITLLLANPVVAAAPPSLQTQIYYNARAALREGHPTEAVKLWLLRNTLESSSGKVSDHDADFRSVIWAALGELGLCQDGFPRDQPGVGLWPVAVHNWLLRTRRRSIPGSGPPTFEAFRHGQQQRRISIRDVLDAGELHALRLQRRGCVKGRELLFDSNTPFDDLRDKKVLTRVLRSLLQESLRTLSRERVVGRAAVQARIFDLNLNLAGLAARETRKQQRQARARGPQSKPTGQTQARLVASPDSEVQRILKDSLNWNAEEWLSLSSDRRQFLFARALIVAPDPRALQPLQLAVIDALIAARQGTELQSWLAWVASATGEQMGQDTTHIEDAKRSIWQGDRGRRLMTLDPETGFRERASIALHRGVHSLSRGRLPEALRSLAYSLRWAEDSREGEAVSNLTRRWLSFVAAQFQVTERLLLMLRNVVPRGDFALVLEDQLWHAALAADSPSFERCVQHQPARAALTRRARVLRLLSAGNVATFVDTIASALEESPYFAKRMLRQLLERLEAENASARARHVPMLRQLEARLVADNSAPSTNKRNRRATETLLRQIRSISEGVVGLVGDNEAARAHSLSPDRQVFVGSLRLAPTDPVPWPFMVAPVQSPPAFTPLSLRPEEWSDNAGGLIFGWRVGD